MVDNQKFPTRASTPDQATEDAQAEVTGGKSYAGGDALTSAETDADETVDNNPIKPSIATNFSDRPDSDTPENHRSTGGYPVNADALED